MVEFFNAVLNEEFNDFRNGSEESTERLEIINDKGDIVIPIKNDWNKIIEVVKNYNDVFDSYSSIEYFTAGTFYDNVSDKVLKLKVTLEKALEIGIQILDTTNKFAGMLFIADVDGDELLINPMHPGTLLSILKSPKKEKLLNTKGTVMIFEFLNEVEKNLEEYNKAIELNAIIAAYTWNSFTETAKLSSRVVEEEKNFDDVFSLALISGKIKIERKAVIPSIIVPFQIISKGMVLPYFGWGTIKTSGGGIQGISLPGNLSGNLKANHDSRENNVCTGSHDNNTYRGWQTLSKINMNSMWFSEIIHRRYKELSYGAMEVTKMLWQKTLPGVVFKSEGE